LIRSDRHYWRYTFFKESKLLDEFPYLFKTESEDGVTGCGDRDRRQSKFWVFDQSLHLPSSHGRRAECDVNDSTWG